MNDSNTDILAEARNAQWSADEFLGEGSIKAVSPAKVNLFLGVGARRPDGYHNVVNIMHTLALHDTLYVNCLSEKDAAEHNAPAISASNFANAGPNKNLQVCITIVDKTAGLGRSGSQPLSIPTEQNLVFKAIDALSHAINQRQKQVIFVHVEKNIPAQAGLGGGSSNAAAALVAMSHFWDISAASRAGAGNINATLAQGASKLGADVAFFLQGGCALYTGIGEKFEHSLKPQTLPAVLVKPALGASTNEVYAEFDAHPEPIPDKLLASAFNAQTAGEVSLFNNLEAASKAIVPEIGEIKEWLTSQLAHDKTNPEGASLPLLSGSGSASFAITDTFAQATSIATKAQAKGFWARATTFSKLRAAVV